MLKVRTSTMGEDVDPDGYTLTVNGSTSASIGANETIPLIRLPAGLHEVALSGIAGNCTVEDANPTIISVESGAATSIVFSVNCSASTGSDLAEVGVPAEGVWSSPIPILQPGSSGAWDERLAGPAPASVIKKDGTYYLYYVGAAGNRRSDGGPAYRAVGLATSTDGRTWTKHPSNPVISWRDIHDNNEEKGTRAFLVDMLRALAGKQNVEEEGAWGATAYVDEQEIILYVADLVSKGSSSVNGDIRLYTSTDGVNFTDQGIVLAHDDSTFPGDDEKTPVGVYKDDAGNWHLYYVGKGKDVKSWSVYHAAGPARDHFRSARLVKEEASDGKPHRYGDGMVILRKDDAGVKIGQVLGHIDGIDFVSYVDSTLSADTLEASYRFPAKGAAIYLDRHTNEWLILHNDGTDDTDAIDLRTAPAQQP